jgi:crotonobetainyl-CoA:carnitine CoA-transferase CaiB-like acyl-CoA transferase
LEVVTVAALDGVRILDLTRGVHGPLGVMLLAEHGADVVKVEPPGGDPYRDWPGQRVWNRGRRSVELDLGSAQGKERFLALLGTADVLVESFRPGAMAGLGLDYPSLRDRFARLVYLSAPAYPAASRSASRPGWDALVQARAGLQYEQPGWRPGPIFLQSPVASMATAYLVPAGILAALSAREETGRGQHVETSLVQGAMALTTMLWVHAERGQNELMTMMAKASPPGIHQRSIYRCADGWIHATGGRRAGGRTMGQILGLPEGVDPNLPLLLAAQGTPEALEQAGRIQQQVAAAFLTFSVAELVETLHANGLGAETIVATGEMLLHPQLAATDSVVDLDDPEVGRTTQLGVTIKLQGTPGRVRGPRPTVGQHTEEVLAEVAAADGPRGGLTTAAVPGPDHRHALEDVRVLDFGRAFAGPFACMVLAGFGADVIRVEAPGVAGMGGAPFLGCQQGKRALALDMKRPEGREIVEALIARSDVVHHNMTKGVAGRLGIDHETLRRIKPDIISCNTFMYGPEGPLSDLGGLDPLAQAAAGLEYEAGPVREGSTPLWYRFGHGDTANALSSVVGVLLALYHRKRTGEGQSLWTSLLHATALWGSGVYRGPEGPSAAPRLDGRQTGTDALYRLYETQEGWLQLAAVKPEHWTPLCAVLGRPDLASDARFTTPAGRRRNRATLEAELEAAFAAQNARHWRRRLDAAGVPSEIAVDTHDGETVLFDEENVRLGLVTAYTHPVHGTLRQAGQLVTFADTPGRTERPPALPGQHTVEIMRWLGYDDAQLARWAAEGIVAYPDGALDA